MVPPSRGYSEDVGDDAQAKRLHVQPAEILHSLLEGREQMRASGF
jgi:hypothetical protein